MRKEKSIQLAETGAVVKIERLEGGESAEARLVGMGMIPGAEVKVIKNDNHGPIVVAVKNDRVAIGRKMSEKIIVS